MPTLFHQLQAQGWKVGTVTSVPFDHASPAAMYAHNVHRDDYQDLARDMLGLPGDRPGGAARSRRTPASTSSSAPASARQPTAKTLAAAGQERRARATSTSPTPTRRPSTSRTAASTSSSQTEPGVERRPGAARRPPPSAAGERPRLFGFFGTNGAQPPALPHRRRPLRPRRPDLDGKAETYTAGRPRSSSRPWPT